MSILWWLLSFSVRQSSLIVVGHMGMWSMSSSSSEGHSGHETGSGGGRHILDFREEVQSFRCRRRNRVFRARPSKLALAIAWNFVQVDSVCRKAHAIGVGGSGALRVGVSASLCGEGAVSLLLPSIRPLCDLRRWGGCELLHGRGRSGVVFLVG